MASKTTVDGRDVTVRFGDITFEDYGQRALDPALSPHEKVGFPDAFREGFTQAIWTDMAAKLPALGQPGSAILDIGCGCGPLPRVLIDNALQLGQCVTLNDHENMLRQLPEAPCAALVAGRFPDVAEAIRASAPGGFDAIICYSVLQVVAGANANPFLFVDEAMAMLKPGGRLLVGDIPNSSKLRRFLSSDAGIAYNRDYMKTDAPPHVPAFALHKDRLDDGAVMGIVMRARIAGFDAYVMPQAVELPMATRREDIVIARP